MMRTRAEAERARRTARHGRRPLFADTRPTSPAPKGVCAGVCDRTAPPCRHRGVPWGRHEMPRIQVYTHSLARAASSPRLLYLSVATATLRRISLVESSRRSDVERVSRFNTAVFCSFFLPPVCLKRRTPLRHKRGDGQTTSPGKMRAPRRIEDNDATSYPICPLMMLA